MNYSERPITNSISANDRKVIDVLRTHDSITVVGLVNELGVTATAIRQRLNRLMAHGYIERTQVSAGRGRPSHKYCLTDEGRQSAGNNLGDLAVVLWEEVRQIADKAIRDRVISGVVERLSEKYLSSIDGKTVEQRMASITQLFSERHIPITFETVDGLPVINVSGCPYPELAKGSRDICEMETDMLSRVLGSDVDLCQCQQDGDSRCSFQRANTQLRKSKAK